MNWLLVGIVVGATVMGDLLQSLEMKQHGEIRDFRPQRDRAARGVFRPA